MTIGIYKITSPSGRVYIGQSWNIEKRWKRHKKFRTRVSGSSQTILQVSFVKYGTENHSYEIIQELPETCSQLDLDRAEIFYIAFYKSQGSKMMNCTEGGSHGKFSQETKNKLKGRVPWNKGTQGIMIPWNKGVHGVWKMSDEQRKKISDALKGKQTTGTLGKPRSKSAIRKTTLKNRGQKRTDEQQARISASMIGRPYHGKNNGLVRSKETRNKISESLKSRTDNKGEQHNMAKLTEIEVLEIRKLYKPRTYSARKIARKFGISKTTVLGIVSHKTWRHI